MPMAEGIKYDVIIIGGGISGLTAAYHLKKRDENLRVVVLEAKDRVGGRTQTIPLKSRAGTNEWDIGGQWVGRCQPHIMSLLLELGLETHPQYTKGKNVQQLGGLNISVYNGDLPSLSVFALIDLHRFISKVENCRKLVKPDDPYACPMAEEWDSVSAEHFIQQNCYTQGAIDAVEVANRTIFGTESSQISCLFWFTYISAADGIIKLCEAKEFTAQESTIKGGAQQISELLAERIGHENVLLQHPVVHVEQNGTEVKVTTKTGSTYIAEYAVFAMPPPLLESITFSPSLPETKRDMCKRMTFGNYTKIIITYQEAFWRKAGFSGEVVTNGGMTAVPNCSSGPLCIMYDACLYNNSPALLGFIAGDIKVEWTQQSPEARRRAVLDQAADYFGKDIYNYIDYIEKDWNHEPYSCGAPVCIMPVGSMPVFAKTIRHPFERLYFAGTETATSWCGYMNGAVQAGRRAAAEVLEKLRPLVLTREDHAALESSHLASRPEQGLSHQRWLKQPRRNFFAASLFRWTVGFSVVVGIFLVAKKFKIFRAFSL